MPYYLLPLIAPLALVVSTFVAFALPGRRYRLAAAVAEIAALLALASALGSLGILILCGPGESPFIGVAGIGFSVRLDAVSAAMLLLVALTVGHVFMIFTVDPYSLRSMITGGYDESLSPEARNARPFVHLRRRPASNETPKA